MNVQVLAKFARAYQKEVLRIMAVEKVAPRLQSGQKIVEDR
jgi:hypothetical protein